MIQSDHFVPDRHVDHKHACWQLVLPVLSSCHQERHFPTRDQLGKHTSDIPTYTKNFTNLSQHCFTLVFTYSDFLFRYLRYIPAQWNQSLRLVLVSALTNFGETSFDLVALKYVKVDCLLYAGTRKYMFFITCCTTLQ